MEAHQERVVKEHEELLNRVVKLEDFIGGTVFANLPVNEQVRLKLQFKLMEAYDDVLTERIRNF